MTVIIVVSSKVADLHGELLEFNERLHKQVNYYQYQVRRLREELVHLRGPVRAFFLLSCLFVV